MPNINDRIGSQNVIRVLSNAAAPPTKLINLSDVNSTLKDQDGLILVWNLPSQSFIMTSVIDNSLSILGITKFTDQTQSTSPTNGALVISGGVGVGKNLNVGGSLTVSGIATFSNLLDANGGATIDNLRIGVAGDNEIDTSTGNLTIDSAGGTVTVDDNLTVNQQTLINGNLTIIGASLFNNIVSIFGSLTVTDGIYYEFGDYDGPNGVAYFDNSGKLIGSASTESFATTTNYVLTTDQSGDPTWSSIIDGGQY